jgi:hypothetical protein
MEINISNVHRKYQNITIRPFLKVTKLAFWYANITSGNPGEDTKTKQN